MITDPAYNIPMDTYPEAQVGPTLELDIDALIERYKADPKALALAVQKFYLIDQFESTLSLVMSQREDGLWVVFEGFVNPRMRKFKVLTHISDFKPNFENPRRPPTVALNFLASCALVRQMPAWII